MKKLIKVYNSTQVDIDEEKVVDVIKQLQKIVEETNDDVVIEGYDGEELEFLFEREETDKEYAERIRRENIHHERIKQRELNQLRALKEKYGDVE